MIFHSTRRTHIRVSARWVGVLPISAEASAEDIIAFAKQRVGSVQAPKQVHFVDNLPRSAVGKVQRREVRAMTERVEGE